MTYEQPPQPVETPLPGKSGRGRFAERRGEPAAVLLCSDILRWVIPHVGRFPKNLRHGLGARWETVMTDVLECLVTAQYAPHIERRQALERANARLQVARHLGRLCGELGALSQRQVTYVSGLMVNLGKQVGAWSRASARTASSSSNS